MASIAIIGQDGSGKTTICNKLLESFPNDFKYIYMGKNLDSTNYNLPIAGMIYKINIYLRLKKIKAKGVKSTKEVLDNIDKNRNKDERGKIAAFLRLLNNIAEEWYRLFISKYFQLKGLKVLYDRHFLFDFALDPNDNVSKHRLTARIHNWILNKLYERPKLIIFLYAPAEVLFSRKGEATIEYLNSKNKIFLNVGRKMSNFKIVDATQSLEKVFEDVKGYINRCCYINNK